MFATKWPLNKLKHLFLGVKEGNALLEAGGHHKGQLMTASEYTNQIAEIQQKQQKTKRNSSLSSDNFRYLYILFKDFFCEITLLFFLIHSSSRSDSWRLGHVPPGMIIKPRHHHHHHHKRRNSWTVTRKPSQDSQMSSSR